MPLCNTIYKGAVEFAYSPIRSCRVYLPHL
ncbi:uncharacterized protein METZ01_LOCUS314026, partial [marine metagenome]